MGNSPISLGLPAGGKLMLVFGGREEDSSGPGGKVENS